MTEGTVDIPLDRLTPVYEFGGGFRLDTGACQLFSGQARIPLTPVAFDVLRRLVEKSGEVVPFSELKDVAWKDVIEFEQPLRTCISEIRKALGDHNRTMIVSAPRRGYRFDGAASVSPFGNGPDAKAKHAANPLHSARRIDPYASVKPLPLYYVERVDLQRVLRAFVLGETVKPVAVTALEGMGGVGKTELARALCHDPVVRAAFPDGIVWIDIGRESGRALLDRMKTVARALNDDLHAYDTDNCAERYRTLLIDKAVLIVLDDVWNKADVDAFLIDSPRCRLLFTTRDIRIAARLGAQNCPTNLLDDDQARSLLAKCSGRSVDQQPAAAEEIIRECGYLPKGICEISSALRGKPDQRWSDVLEKLQGAQVPSLYAPTKVSVDVLGEERHEIRRRYLQLAVLPGEMTATLPIVQTLWAVDPIAARDTMEELESRSLARREDGGIQLHDLQLDYIRSEFPDQTALALIHQAMRLSQHVVRRDANQFASQLMGRLLGFGGNESISNLLRAVFSGAPRPWLRPLTPVLKPPGVGLTRILEGHTNSVEGVAVSRDGRRAISASYDKTLKVWDLESGRELWTLAGHTRWVMGVAMSADGRRAVSASYDGTLKVWDLESGCELRTLTGHTRSVMGVALTDDGRLAISASRDCKMKVWDVASGHELRSLVGHTDEVKSVVMSADGRRAVSASRLGRLKVWDVGSGRELPILADNFSLGSGVVAISANGRRAVAPSHYDGTLKAWDVQSGRELRTLKDNSIGISAVALSDDGQRAILGYHDGTLKVWDLDSDRGLQTLGGHTDAVSSVAVSADGRLAVSGSRDRTVRVWDVQAHREPGIRIERPLAVMSVAVSADGRRAVVANYFTGLGVWDLKARSVVRIMFGHHDRVTGVAISANGRRAVSASNDKTLKVWDLKSGRELQTLVGHAEGVTGVAVSAAGRRAVSASNDKTLKVWDMKSGRELWTLVGHTEKVLGVAVSADGRLAVSASYDCTLKVWDVKSGRELRTLVGHTLKVTSVGVSAAGRRAVSGSDDKTLKVWDLESGHELRTLVGHTGSVMGVTVAANGGLAISASRDRTLKLWDTESGACLATFTCDAAPSCCSMGKEMCVAGDELGNLPLLSLEVLEETAPRMSACV